MTHSLHRVRIQSEDIEDFVILCTPAIGINHEACAKYLIYILDIILELEPDNINFYESESAEFDIEKIKTQIHDKSRLRCCFSDPDKVYRFLKILKKENLGISVVVSGCQDKVETILRKISIQPHTINISAGFYGRTDKLPPKENLSLLTMCGHGLISNNLIKDRVEKLKAGSLSVEEAVHDISRPCTCGIFNPKRAEGLLRQMVDENDSNMSGDHEEA